MPIAAAFVIVVTFDVSLEYSLVLLAPLLRLLMTVRLKSRSGAQGDERTTK